MLFRSRQEGWTSKKATFYVELIDLARDSRVGYVASKMASLISDAEWAAEKQRLLPILTELTVTSEETGAAADVEQGCHGARKVVVDWNSVELDERTYLVIAPIDVTEMAKMFGIPVDDRDKDKDDTTEPVDANTNSGRGDVDAELMADAAYDVDDAHDDELVHVYDKENPVIEVGKLWPNMDEFRMCFKTYAVKHEFEAKTMWTDRKKFYARCQGYDLGAN